jgi:hypothetical protein
VDIEVIVHIVEVGVAGSGVQGLYTHYNSGRTICYIAGHNSNSFHMQGKTGYSFRVAQELVAPDSCTFHKCCNTIYCIAAQNSDTFHIGGKTVHSFQTP